MQGDGFPAGIKATALGRSKGTPNTIRDEPSDNEKRNPGYSYTNGVSNGPTEAINGVIKSTRRVPRAILANRVSWYR